jgi:flavin-dependent dehydrogenase
MRFPEKDRRWFKFKNLIKIDGEYWIVPIEQGLYEVGSVCAIEDTPDAAIKKVEERAKEIDAYDIEVRIDAVQEALDTIEKAKAIGINF